MTSGELDAELEAKRQRLTEVRRRLDELDGEIEEARDHLAQAVADGMEDREALQANLRALQDDATPTPTVGPPPPWRPRSRPWRPTGPPWRWTRPVRPRPRP